MTRYHMKLLLKLLLWNLLIRPCDAFSNAQGAQQGHHPERRRRRCNQYHQQSHDRSHQAKVSSTLFRSWNFPNNANNDEPTTAALMRSTLSSSSLFMTTSSSSTNDSTSSEAAKTKISYRKARIEDLPGIAGLLERSFDDDEEEGEEKKQKEERPSSPAWTSWNPFQKKKNDEQEPSSLDETQKLIQLLEQRLTLPQHILIVATDEEKVVGFMELGTMPAPISISVPINIPSSAQKEEEEMVMVRPERPFLANLAVDPNCRRQQMGSKLVQLALKIAMQWESQKAVSSPFFYFHPSLGDKKKSALYLSVDCDNDGAIAFYKRLQFTTVLDEESSLKNEDDTPATTTTRSTKGGARKPKLYLEKELVLSIEDDDKQ